MDKRFVSIWFRYLTTDWFTLFKPELRYVPFVLKASSHGKMIVTATNAVAEKKGISCGMAITDARAIVPELEVMDERPDLTEKLLKRLAEWCIRFTPIVAIDSPNGLFFDATGCSHLWGGDEAYVKDIAKRLNIRGYHVHVVMADTPGVAWGAARFSDGQFVIEPGAHLQAILSLPPEALRLEPDVVERLHKLGLHQVRQFINIPRHSLRKRFGNHLLMRLDMALGQELEIITPVEPVEPYQERLPCLEPIVTATGIEIALYELLKKLCGRLQQEQKGLRLAILKCYRVDRKMIAVNIGTNRPSHHVDHLFKLFEIKLPSIEPDLGIELFVLKALKVEDHHAQQEKIWEGSGGLHDPQLYDLVDRLANRIGKDAIQRYLPAEHYWPERSYYAASSLDEEPVTSWRVDQPRPLHVLSKPERIEVTAPIPDYPPMLFKYKGKLYKIVKADGPERIAQEWWLQQGPHRDYYRVEDEEGNRYWLFRSGYYNDKNDQWFLHGFFA